MSYSGWGDLTVPGEITGYRSWRPVLSAPEPTLSAYTQDYTWELGRNVAQCFRRPRYHPKDLNKAPSRTCTCGFYARSADEDHGYNVGMCGVIKASGRVILGQTGFRAEFARIVALYSDPRWDSYRDNYISKSCEPWATTWRKAQLNCAGRYEVPLFNSFEEAIEAFPPDDLSAFRKAPPAPSEHPTVIVTQLDANGQPISGSVISISVQLPGWPGVII